MLDLPPHLQVGKEVLTYGRGVPPAEMMFGYPVDGDDFLHHQLIISCLRWSFFFQCTIGVTPYLWYFWDGAIALLFVGIDHEKMAFCELDENTSCNQTLFTSF